MTTTNHGPGCPMSGGPDVPDVIRICICGRGASVRVPLDVEAQEVIEDVVRNLRWIAEQDGDPGAVITNEIDRLEYQLGRANEDALCGHGSCMADPQYGKPDTLPLGEPAMHRHDGLGDHRADEHHRASDYR